MLRLSSLLLLLLLPPQLAVTTEGVASPPPPPAPPAGPVYLQVGDANRKDLKGDWLSFSGLDMKFYAPNQMSGRAPFLLVPAAGTPGGFSLQNLWRGYSESRFGHFVAVGADNDLVLVPGPVAPTFTAVYDGAFGGAFYLRRAGDHHPRHRPTDVWVGAGKATDTDVIIGGTTERASWSWVAAPDAVLPLSGPPVFFQVAAGAHKNDWIGFDGTTVCCGEEATLRFHCGDVVSLRVRVSL